MKQFTTVETVPFKPVEHAFRPLGFDDQSHGTRLRSLRRVSDMGWEQEDITLSDDHLVVFSTIHHLEYHVSPELVKELLDRVVVKIRTLVGTANHCYH
jgi:hypothetical protein